MPLLNVSRQDFDLPTVAELEMVVIKLNRNRSVATVETRAELLKVNEPEFGYSIHERICRV